MIQRPLMTADELKTLKKGHFIVTKTGSYPMHTVLKLFLEWGITFGKAYEIEEKSARKVAYADKDELVMEIINRSMVSVDDSDDDIFTPPAAQGGTVHTPVDEKPRRKPSRQRHSSPQGHEPMRNG